VAATLDLLAAEDPEECYRFLYPNVGGPPVRTTRARKQAKFEVLQELVESSSANRAPVGDKLAWSAHFNTAWARLEAKHGEDLLQLEHPQAPGADRPQICLLTREVLAEILRLPDGEAAQALRWMYREPDREGS
jgi:hypothetical protein